MNPQSENLWRQTHGNLFTGRKTKYREDKQWALNRRKIDEIVNRKKDEFQLKEVWEQ